MTYAHSRSGYPSTTATGRVADNLAGRAAAERLTFGALHAGIRVGFLLSRLDDWNSDLQAFGATETRAALLSQLLDPEDLPPTA